jgi:outer membrane protein assembly factor BamA
MGVLYDSRDNEIFPHKGFLHQVDLRFAQGLPTEADVEYGAVAASFAGYLPLGSLFVLAARGLTDIQVGNVPFFDLFTGGPFQTYDMPGGPSGIRGVPSGRYAGRVKLVANMEARALLLDFRLLGQTFRIGGDAFFDTGRVFVDTTFSSPLDGKGVGLKYGVGGGAYLLWGQAALFRLELAYSPDQVAANPGFPVGIYAEDGVMF